MSNVLITGGSRGIGAAAVRLFCQQGHKVAFTYKQSAQLASDLAKECGAFAIQADSAVADEIYSAVSKARELLGSIDCLINNAAISSFSLFTDISLEQWNECMAVNLTAPFLYAREAARDMINGKWGRIINISSVWGLIGSSCEVHYSSAKAGLIGMTKALAKELGPSGITVNAIAPGVINTEMNSELRPEDIRALCDETPVMRVGEPREVAELALYLCSDKSGFINGAVLNISGGFVV